MATYIMSALGNANIRAILLELGMMTDCQCWGTFTLVDASRIGLVFVTSFKPEKKVEKRRRAELGKLQAGLLIRLYIADPF